jgi:hypothetical protein
MTVFFLKLRFHPSDFIESSKEILKKRHTKFTRRTGFVAQNNSWWELKISTLFKSVTFTGSWTRPRNRTLLNFYRLWKEINNNNNNNNNNNVMCTYVLPFVSNLEYYAMKNFVIYIGHILLLRLWDQTAYDDLGMRLIWERKRMYTELWWKILLEKVHYLREF